MIYAWLDLPTLALFAVLSLFYGATAAAIYWLFFRSPVRGRIHTWNGVVAPFFGATGILFALLTSFLASDIGDRNRQAWRAVHTEASAATSLATLSIASVADMAAIRAALRTYLQSAVVDEWPSMTDRGGSPKTEAAQAALLSEVSDPKIAGVAGQAVHNALLATVLRMSDARADRLALASDHTNDLKWATVLILGVLTQFALGLVHLERARAKLAAITVFTIAAVITLGLIAIQEQPFDGPISISPAPIAQALKSVAE